VRCYDVASDGQHFYAGRVVDQPPPVAVTHLNIVENWFEVLKARVGRR